MMGVINQKLQQTKNEFILLSDLLISLGEHTQDTLRDIFIFLKNENIQKIDLYELKDFQPKKICPPDFPMGASEILLSELLEQGINTFCIFDYFVFNNSFDFDNLALNPQVFGKVKPKSLGVSDEQEKFLYKLCYKNNLAFKKSDLMQQDWFDEVFLTTSDNKANNNQPTTVQPTAEQQQITDLQAENARLQARIAELESELNQANNTPDKQLGTRSKNLVVKILKAVIDLGELEIGEPYSKEPNSLNELILAQLIRNKHSVSKQKIGDWLALAKEIEADK